MSSLSPDSLLAHHQWVRGLARSLVLDDQEADDVVQETWLAALQSPPSQQSSLRAWLAQVVRNAARQLARGESRRTQRERAAASTEAITSTATADLVARAEAQKIVVDAVLGLREPYLSTVLLRYYESLPPREVARRLGVPVETVRARLRRAMDQLRGVLDRKQGGREAWGMALLPLATGPAPIAPPLDAPSTAVDRMTDLVEPLRVRFFRVLVPAAVVLTAAIGAGVGTYALVRPDRRPAAAPVESVATTSDAHSESAAEVKRRVAEFRASSAALASELEQLQEELAATRAEIERTKLPLIELDAPTARKRGTARMSIPGEEHALELVDWDTIGDQVRTFLQTQRRITTAIAAGEQWSAEDLGRRSSANGALVEVEVALCKAYGEPRLPNENFTRPAILGNLLLVTLEAYGLPADDQQRAAITRVTVERTRQLAMWDEGHDAHVAVLRELQAMTRLRRRYVDDVFAILTPEQLVAVRTSAEQERTGMELFSDSIVLHNTGYGVAGRGRDWLRETMTERMADGEAELPAAAAAVLEAWLAALPDEDFTYTPVALDKHTLLPASLLRTWLGHSIGLMDLLEATPELAPYAERLGSDLEIPLPVASDRKR